MKDVWFDCKQVNPKLERKSREETFIEKLGTQYVSLGAVDPQIFDLNTSIFFLDNNCLRACGIFPMD